MKKLIALLIAVIMVVSMIPVMAISTSADNGEQATPATGDWDVYRFANSYPSEDDDEDTVYAPTAGYAYTTDGFTVIGADYTDTTPSMTVQTTDKVNLKDGLYLQWRIDNYSYDGGTGEDQWIAPSFTTQQMVAPGNTKYGGGWLSLIRGKGDGACTSLPHLTNPATEDFGGTFGSADPAVISCTPEVPMDEQGREIYTLEVQWIDGTGYEIKINGMVQPGNAQATALLEQLDANGEFYVGVSMQANVKNGTAACTILKFGTSEADATTPVGDDSREPEENEMTIAEIADPTTIEANNPAILWKPSTRTMKTGNNVVFTAQGDDTWKAAPTAAQVFWQFTPKRTWSYSAVDFPVFGIMFRNIWIDSGSLWYAAGDVMGPKDGCTLPFSIYDGEFYGEDEEYVFVPVDITDLWEGRINCVRLDFNVGEDQSNWEFEICFAGMFRSEDEAYAYAETYLNSVGVATNEPETDAPTDPAGDTDVATDAATDAPTNAVEDSTTAEGGDDAAAAGCASVVGMGAVAILAAAAAAVALKKKD